MATPNDLPLALADYRDLVALDAPFLPPPPAAPHSIGLLVERAYAALLERTPPHAWARRRLRLDQLARRDALTALLTSRTPDPPIDHETHVLIDQILGAESRARATTEASALPEQHPSAAWHCGGATCALWQGDITTLRIDAIVNAANDALLGCFEPFHGCIDNAIHRVAGPRLREDCHRIMQRQGHAEPTGAAKLTRGYHLPAPFVLHTVGPVVQGALRQQDALDLASAYRSCLDLAAQVPAIRSVAFCAISTGVFGFPKPAAAQIALATVDTWLREHPGALDLVVFNVFDDHDRAIYEQILPR